MSSEVIVPEGSSARIAREVTAPTVDRYAKLAEQELAAFVQLLEQLSPDDWSKPTACALWDVRDVVAHQGGHVQMGSGFRGFVAQLDPRGTRPYRKRGMSTLDALNQRQVEMRRAMSTEDLIAEVRDGTPRAIASRGRLNPVARRLRVPAPPVGWVGLGTLLHRIFPRDMWVHRLDVADATGKPFTQARGHDDAMLELTVADAANSIEKKSPGLCFRLTLTGPAGGSWIVGGTGSPTWELRMDVTDFMRRSSGRIDVATALTRTESNAPEAATRACLEVLQALY
jgi:uncharacterized protein (TIGR03083 family)